MAGKLPHIEEEGLERRQIAWELRCKGYTYEKIGQELGGISPPAVSKMLAKSRAEFREHFLADMKQITDELASTYMWAMDEARQAWRDSRDRPSMDNPHGEAKHLANFMEAGAHIRKIYGLDKPIKVQAEHKGEVKFKKFTLTIPNANQLTNPVENPASSEEKLKDDTGSVNLRTPVDVPETESSDL
jgi:hypothetical protein